MQVRPELIHARDGGSVARRFDATVGAITAREPVDDEQTEDVALTDYLTRAWLDLVNPRSQPLPRCPHCQGGQLEIQVLFIG